MTDYVVHDGGHEFPDGWQRAILTIVEIEQRHKMSTDAIRHIQCSRCGRWATVVFNDDTFSALSDCTVEARAPEGEDQT
jgi:hypothetical protein